MSLVSLRGRGNEGIARGYRSRSCRNVQIKAIWIFFCILFYSILLSQLLDVLYLCSLQTMEGFKQGKNITNLTLWRDGSDD